MVCDLRLDEDRRRGGRRRRRPGERERLAFRMVRFAPAKASGWMPVPSSANEGIAPPDAASWTAPPGEKGGYGSFSVAE
jgi:hypothetical protein